MSSNRGEGRDTLSLQSTKLKKAYIARRGAAVGLLPNQFARAIINEWFVMQAPQLKSVTRDAEIPFPDDLALEVKTTNAYHP